MTTAASIREAEPSHWYSVTGEAVYEVPKANGQGMTKTTLRHARKMNLLPSVTTVLRLLEKPALTQWKIEQAVLAVLTTYQADGEPIDDFVKRVLSKESQQDQERDAAAALGTKIHSAIEDALAGRTQTIHPDIWDSVRPAIVQVARHGGMVWSERICVGNGYAGRSDLYCTDGTLIDFKTTKKLPKESYVEHKLQLAAYGRSNGVAAKRTANIYISTTEPGQIAVCENEDVDEAFEAFEHLLKVWQWVNGYVPEQEPVDLIP